MFLSPILNDSFIKLARLNDTYLNTIVDNNYCIINLKKDMIQLSLFIVKNYDKKCMYQINFYAISSRELFYLMNQHKNICYYLSFSHALYIGKEIYKVELSKVFQQTYVQL